MRNLNIKFFIVKYIAFIFFAIGIFLDHKIDISEEFDNQVIDIVISMLPMATTIISISLSMNSELIYGIESSKFRKLRKDINFNFMEMLIITILIFILTTICVIINFTISIWFLDIIAIIYAFVFVVQEIPLLMKSDKRFKKIIKKAWYKEENSDFNLGNASNGKELQNVIQYLVLNQGVSQTFIDFKCKDSKKNIIILDTLLSLNNDFLSEYIDSEGYIIDNCSESPMGINIYTAINISLNSIKEILSFNESFNIVRIYNYSNHYFYIMRMIFLLHKICTKLKLIDKFNNSMMSSIRILSYLRANSENIVFKNHFLNSMLISSVSHDELWFITLLRDSEFYGLYIPETNRSYVIFLSIYYFYLMKIDNKVPEELKEKLNSFFLEPSKSLNSNNENWYYVIKHFIESTSFSEISHALIDLLSILKNEHRLSPWYMPDWRNSWSSEDGELDSKLIFNCWLEIIFYSYQNFLVDINSIDSVINQLSDEEKYELAFILEESWFQDGINFSGYSSSSFVDFYSLRFVDKGDCMDKLRKYFFEKKNSINNKYYEKSKEMYVQSIDSDYLNNIKKDLISTFEEKKKKIDLYDEKLSCDDKTFSYSMRLENNYSSQYIDVIMANINSIFNKIINKKTKEESIKNVSELSGIEKILMSNKYNMRSSKHYQLLKKGISRDTFNKINSVKASNVHFDNFFLWVDGAIRFNTECDKENTYVRKLNDFEINDVIEKEYKVSEGLYKYNEGDNNRNIFITREELYDLISKRYSVACICFRWNISIDAKNIILIDINDI